MFQRMTWKRNRMTERFWTPERKKDYYQLVKQKESRRKYMREYMKKARGTGKYLKKSYEWSSSEWN